ncbi:MAG TPA: hypothetical protein VK137_03180, partial [Planctomycetaceae bacterium]|nr:hypothetical protein [Planctomycetaceae bacterium]
VARPAVLSRSERATNELDKFSAVVLANVPLLTDSQLAALTDYVQHGGGLGLALGNRVEKDRYSASLFAAEAGLLGVSLTEIESEPPEHREEGVYLANASLEAPWLQRFRAERGAAFTTARFSRWWKTELRAPADPANASPLAPLPNPLPEGAREQPQEAHDRKPAIVLARLQTGAPYLVSGEFGRGRILLLTAPLDADWSTLPAKPDYVAFLHELLFQLASRRGDRNVAVGQALVSPLTEDMQVEGLVFEGPDGEPRTAKPAGDDSSRLAVLDDTALPGVYVLRRKEPADEQRLSDKADADHKPNEPAKVAAPKPLAVGPGRELFVVNADRAESNLTPLTDEQIATITAEDRLRFIREPREIRLAASKELPRHELWQLLLLAFLALLVFEVLMTRRLVKGGHVATDAESSS